MKIVDDLITPFFIECEDKGFVLKETGVKKSGNNIGEEYEETVGYFVDFGSMLHRITTMKIARNESVVDIKTYISLYKDKKNALLHIISGPPTIQE